MRLYNPAKGIVHALEYDVYLFPPDMNTAETRTEIDQDLVQRAILPSGGENKENVGC